MTTLEKIRAKIQKVIDTERDFTSENAKAQALALNWVLELFDKYAEQEPTDEWQNGYDMAWEEAKVFYEKEPTDDKCHYCEHNFTPYQGNTGEFTEQEPCDDVVSRQAVIGELKDMYKATERWSQDATEDDIKARADAVMATLIEQKLRVEALPSVRPQEPKTGHWIETYSYDPCWYMCSECHRRTDDISDYCPNCGARMESEDKE